jgi:alkylated DNA repair dioxygenase AlkB
MEELLGVASRLWLPTDTDLAPHLKTQQVHHEKRQRWSSQLLLRLSSASHTNFYWDDDRLARAVLATALPFDGDKDRPNREGRYLKQALQGLHALSGKATTTNVHPDICKALRIIIERVEGMAQVVSLSDAVEMRWAARGLLARMGPERILDAEDGPDLQLSLTKALPNLELRVSALPFDIVPLGVQWESLELQNAASTLRNAIPFSLDKIVTRSGAAVTERRGTAWVAEEGIGSLAYSGKLMPPRPIPDVVRDTMRLVERNVLDKDDPQPFFDCALCNHYPDGEAACKFHTDPEHGTLWERLTCVVAAGDERRFAFRPIPGTSTWSEWDNYKGTNAEEPLPAVIHLFAGDVVKMWGSCNDDFHHAVYTAEHDNAGDRVSLVFKRAINRGGKRGHGLQGEGRRSRRRAREIMNRQQ